MNVELIQVMITGAAGTLGGGGGAWLAIRVHIDHIRERQDRQHDDQGKLYDRIADHDRRLTAIEARQ